MYWDPSDENVCMNAMLRRLASLHTISTIACFFFVSAVVSAMSCPLILPQNCERLSIAADRGTRLSIQAISLYDERFMFIRATRLSRGSVVSGGSVARLIEPAMIASHDSHEHPPYEPSVSGLVVSRGTLRPSVAVGRTGKRVF